MQSMTSGHIYILLNAAMPGYLKIGMTTRSPDDRAREVSHGTGVAVPYTVAFSEAVVDCALAEGLIHTRLAEYRVNRGREFFHLPLQQAIRALSEIAIEVGVVQPAPVQTTLVAPSVFDSIDVPDISVKQDSSRPQYAILASDAQSEPYIPADRLVTTGPTGDFGPEVRTWFADLVKVVLEICPDCLARRRDDGAWIFVPPSRASAATNKNMLTLWPRRSSLKLRIMPNKEEMFDSKQMDSYRQRLHRLGGQLLGAS